jgi:radical SAM superfamily enzyme
LDYFAELARHHYVAIEYGIESTYDETLRAVNRGHDFATARLAVEMTAERTAALCVVRTNGRAGSTAPGCGIDVYGTTDEASDSHVAGLHIDGATQSADTTGLHIGAHFILGFPGETEEMLIAQTDTINSLPLTTVKFHQLQIFRGTVMEQEYLRDPAKFPFRTMDEYIDFFIEILRRLRPSLVVERFAGEAPPRHRIGRDWGLVRNEELMSKLEKRLAELDVRQGDLYKF